MLIDGRSLDGQTIEADLCICGGGAAGIALALEMRSLGISVVLLESGDVELDEQTQQLAEAENTSFVDFPVETTRLRYLGGTTNHWGGFTYPFSEFDMTPRAYSGNTTWPIAHADLAKYYPAAGVLCELGRMAYEEVDGWQTRAGFTPLRMPQGPMQTAVGQFSPPTRFGTAYRQQLDQAASVKVLLNSNVQELIASDDASRVERARVACLGGASFNVTAKVFVVALGGIETARLLLLSRGQQTAGLGNGQDLVGRHYADHCGFTGGEVRFAAPDAMGFFTDFHTVDDSLLYGLFTPRTEVLQRENIGNFRIQLFPRLAVPGIDSLHALREEPSRLGEHLGNILVDLDQVSDLIYKNLLHKKFGLLKGVPSRTSIISGAIMHISAEQVPNSESRVMLSEQRDVFGQQKVNLHWRIQEGDRRTMLRGYELFADAFSSAGLGRVRVPSELRTGDLDRMMEIACHHSGTTRMSDSERAGVVDANCRVHSTSNLYIASSAVFPTYSWVNPTLTIVALTLRLADHLKQQAWSHA
jgi:choline dehydrogenase-like flavoprotein